MGLVKYEKRGHLAIITMENKAKLNALSLSFIGEIAEAFSNVENDREIYVCILTGCEKAFIAGADISEMVHLSGPESLYWGKAASELGNMIENSRVPVIAAVNGFCLGGGNEVAMSCDIRYASEKAKFGQPEVGLGITPGAGGTQRLPRLIGAGKAKELLYTGRVIGAQEAYEIGLVQKVVPHEELMDACIALANEIMANAQIAVQETKKCVDMGLNSSIQAGVSYEQQAFAVCNSSEDKKIGMNAFLEKKKEKPFIYK
jgi:enoyl-CoA hydratase